ncbi:GntR family transcriptional regulator [Streptomyces avicenniae]|uniref:GntR family transcriptional regulator n=1 Tax=Streptomyces avicenniae TaxID=500153 RepID=UPI00069B552F|nr:GntR family transcriptional regulator [Streptomyces avicenniae]
MAPQAEATDDPWARASGAMPRRRVLAEHTYEAIRSLLMDQVLPPGERVNIDEVARRLDVSPTPVREALSRLESEGLVTKRALAGFTATPLLGARGVAELFDLRRYLEEPAASAAAMHRDDADLAALRDLWQGAREPFDGERYVHYRDFALCDAGFHDRVAAASGNGMLRETLTRLQPHTHVYRLQLRVGGQEQTYTEHEGVLTAIAAGDGPAAARAMRVHLDAAEQRLLAVLRREGGGASG